MMLTETELINVLFLFLPFLHSVHFKVEKKEADGRVCSAVFELDHDMRVREVARIMGGEMLTDTLLKSAEEIIENNKK